MRNSFGLRWLATLGLVLVPATAMSSGPFDGSWSVVVACAQAPDGAKAAPTTAIDFGGTSPGPRVDRGGRFIAHLGSR